MSDCIFCRIVAGEIPSSSVASSDDCYAFRDANPVAPTHVLVVPREHIDSASELGPGQGRMLAEMLELANRVAVAEGVSGSGYRLVFNVGSDAGNMVPHLHLHVIGGRQLAWPPG